MLFDAHTHLNYDELSTEERYVLASEIGESEIAYLIDAGDSVKSSKLAIKNAESYEWCYAAVGLHPDQASRYSEADLDKIREFACHPKVKAIGEIGLDFYYGKDDQDVQQVLFRKQIRLANELHMPIMIHTRDANQLTMDILVDEGAFSDERKSWFPKRPGPTGEMLDDARVQLHCYSGSAELAEQYIKLGATISLGGPVTFKNGKRAACVVQRIPVEFLLSETDAPFMAPEPLRGRPNKPYYVEHVVRKMAEIKGLSYEEMSEILLKNGKRFFDIEVS